MEVDVVRGSLELEVERGPSSGLRLTLHEDFRIGSGEEGPGALGDRWLSPTHALIHRGPDGWAIEDQRSLEGTRVNGKPVRGAVTLGPGDTIELGSTRLVVVPPGGERPPPADGAKPRADHDGRQVDNRRVGAALLDSALMWPVVALVRDFAGTALFALVIALALQLTYFFACESLGGQTLGKWLFGLRVVRRDGRPLAPQAVGARTVLRLIDTVLIGVLSMVFTGARRQRLGDLAAGTIVTRSTVPAESARLEGINLLALIGYPLLWLAPAALLYAFVPAARAQPCTDKEVGFESMKEGTCVDPDGRVYAYVNVGSTLHMDGLDAQITKTAVRTTDRFGVVGFRLNVRNTGDAPALIDSGRRMTAYSVAIGRRLVTLRETNRSFRGMPALAPRRGLRLAPGAAREGWVRFTVPLERARGVDPHIGVLEVLPPSHAADGDQVGQFRLWRSANMQGARILQGLRGY